MPVYCLINVYVNTESDDNNISQVLRGRIVKGPPLPSSSNEREGEGAEEGIFVKVPSDLMTPG